MKYQPPTSVKALYNSIKVLPLAIIAGLCLITCILLFFKSGGTQEDGLGDLVVIAVALLAAVCVVMSSYLFRKKVADSMGKPVIDKLVLYRQATIIRFALLDGPALFSIVFFFLTGNYLYLVITGCMALFMILNRPNDEMIAEHLMLTEEDKNALKKMRNE